MSNDGTVCRSVEALPLELGDKITVKHLSGTTHSVLFENIYGDKLNDVCVKWPMAGYYRVDVITGKLLGGGKKGRKAASVWSVTKHDMARIEATREKMREERRELLRKNKGGRP